MSDGQPHPSAFVPTIGLPGHWQAWTDVVIEVQLTSSRLAITILTFISNPPRISFCCMGLEDGNQMRG